MIMLINEPPYFTRKIMRPGYAWLRIPDHPDAELYEQVSLHSYKADRRICMRDLMNVDMGEQMADAAIFEMRLTGIAL